MTKLACSLSSALRRPTLQRLILGTPSSRSVLLYSTHAKEAGSSSGSFHSPPSPSASSRHTFKAETRRLLEIVADSLYSEKEIFVRELISNASDACEKLRFYQLTRPESVSHTVSSPLSISISLDTENSLFILEDKGLGMDRDELERNLGTIALSSASSFVEKNSQDLKKSIIGQFGVGFYSAFTVGRQIDVYSRSALSPESTPAYVWSCGNGDSEYTIAPAAQEHSMPFGTKIVVHLKDDQIKYCSEKTVRELIKKYSSFVSFPVFVNGNQVNTVPALWTLSKSEIASEQYTDFYRHISGSPHEEPPMYILHYSTDAPVQMRCLLFVPKNIASFPWQQSDSEGNSKGSSSKMSLYSKKALIKANTADLLPPWLSFVRGIVDSEDIPLNLSRELLQNSLLISKIKHTLTARIVRWLLDEQKSSPEEFARFYRKLSPFVKGGILHESGQDKKDVIQLLMYESSREADSKATPLDGGDSSSGENTPSFPLTTLKSYVDRMAPSQKDIYIYVAKNRQSALDSPYYEPFKKRGFEVLFSYDPLDEFLIPSLDGYADGKSVKRIEDVNLQEDENFEGDLAGDGHLTNDQISQVTSFLSTSFGKSVKSVKASNRFSSHPALIVDHALQSTTMKYLKQMMTTYAEPSSLESALPVDVEINPGHPLIKNLFFFIENEAELAQKIAFQILDSARMEAGLLEDSHSMVVRLNDLMAILTTRSKP